MKTSAKPACRCGCSLELTADAYFLQYLTERLQAFEAEHRGCRQRPDEPAPQALPDVPVIREAEPGRNVADPINKARAKEPVSTAWKRFDGPDRTCAICGDSFSPKRSNQTLCGKPECRKARRKQHADKFNAKVRDRRLPRSRPMTTKPANLKQGCGRQQRQPSRPSAAGRAPTRSRRHGLSSAGCTCPQPVSTHRPAALRQLRRSSG
ncbi:hypothetical protein [Pseudonocardia charpentierae]|uniref:Uncharacterized protein n=1 Tax=Pseudonocardia charpentierae TaxID=3075545 RepID=A0ABU2ND41_9PSEU|nr:hypothetical protein [Pseudonocardia sp. DSM 45834]MDT0351655.1 hypothetical protein [Pseudonocardia sp. DSM 45834]